ncbi:MAG TPA: PilZ domain-containing protein [Gaiellales bacterium]|nr:PilZ domain-containing protein [Gaiellales bacterium]
MSENQRAFFRIDAVVPVVVHRVDRDGIAWDEFPGETVDLSAGGLLLSAGEYVPTGQAIEVVISSTEPPLDLRSRARIVRSWRTTTGEWLSGVCFERLASQAERDLVKFCFLKEREMAERVSNVRIDIAIPARLERSDRSVHRASTLNICADGARVTAPWDADRDEEVTISFSEDWFGRALSIRARVGRRDERGFDLEFCDPTRADRAAINQLIMAEERRRRVA